MKPGTYFLEALKESEGYASTLGSFHSSGFVNAPALAIAENQRIDSVVLTLGPKAAILTGDVVDAETNLPIENAQVILRRVDNPGQFYSTILNDLDVKGRFKVLVPATPFTIDLKAPGYKDWTYSNDLMGKHKRTNAVHLRSEEVKNLRIALHRLN